MITRLLRGEQPAEFRGKYYQLQDALLLPRPQRPGGPPLVIGGNGEKLTLPLVARFADEWNGVYLTPEKYAERSRRLDQLLAAQGRQPGDVRRTLMTGIRFARSDAELRTILQEEGKSAEELRARGMVVGTAAQVVDQLGPLADVGVQRVMLQWLELDHMDGLEALAKAVL